MLAFRLLRDKSESMKLKKATMHRQISCGTRYRCLVWWSVFRKKINHALRKCNNETDRMHVKRRIGLERRRSRRRRKWKVEVILKTLKWECKWYRNYTVLARVSFITADRVYVLEAMLSSQTMKLFLRSAEL